MRAWFLYVATVVCALAALLLVANALPALSSGVFVVGTPVLICGAGLGAKFVKEVRRRGRGFDN